MAEELGLFVVELPDGARRIARGPPALGPEDMMGRELTIDGLLAAHDLDLSDALRSSRPVGPIPADAVVVAPIESQEVWGAGVTYERSRDERMAESQSASSIYDLVYEAKRPELFFKAPGWRVRGPNQPIGIRADSAWNVPEPELALVISSDMRIVGLTIGNDVSSRSIEADNPLYLPQAKMFDGSCALGPCIVPITSSVTKREIRLTVVRDEVIAAEGTTQTSSMKRPFEDLVEFLGRALTFPSGVILLTGTGIVPEPTFSLAPGDRVRIEIDGLGALQNPVASIGSARP
jgi:2-dehydro-3-deoxy-D-arabinonate dehydratase